MATSGQEELQDRQAGQSGWSVKVENLTKKFGDTVVLDDISLEVGPGEVVAIIGPSGGGKSTLLRCINYLEEPTCGQLYIGGNRVGERRERDGAAPRLSSKELVSLRISVGMVFQSFNLFPHLTALQNVILAQIEVLGRNRKTSKKRAEDLLRRVGLGHKFESYPSQCSGGEQQRIAIARALALDPKVLLFDEPTSALDPELGYEVLAVIRELSGEGMTMMVVTHEMHFAEDVADRVIFMSDSKIVEEGNPRDVLQNPAHDRTKQFLKAVLDR